MTAFQDINTQDWTLDVDTPGAVVTDLQAIDQNARTICYTQKYSDPMDPNFGVDQMSHLDKPVNKVIPGLKKDIVDQLTRYEPRMILISVVGSIDPQAGGYEVLMLVTWKYYNQTVTTKLTYKNF